MCDESIQQRVPLLQIEEVIELLRISGNEGLTFEALSLNLYNRRSQIFVEDYTLRSLRGALRKLLRANLNYFALSEDGCYTLYRPIPQQLFINFDVAVECDIDESKSANLENEMTFQQLELDFDFYDEPEDDANEENLEIAHVAVECFLYANGDKQLLLDF